MDSRQSGPGRAGYVIATIVLVVGLIAAGILVAIFALGLLSLGDDLERTVGPGTGEISLTETGRYTIYYEYRSRVDGVDYESSERTPSLDITVTNASSGEDVQINPSLTSTSYTLTNHAGRSIRTFDIDVPGAYLLQAEYADGSESPEFVLAVGQGVGRGILTSIGAFFGAGLIFCIFTLIAFIIAVVTLLRRRRVDQRPATDDVSGLS